MLHAFKHFENVERARYICRVDNMLNFSVKKYNEDSIYQFLITF